MTLLKIKDDTTDNILYDSQMSSRSLYVFYPMLDI